MMFDVMISNRADEDIRGIFEYIAYELKSPQNAGRQLERLDNAINGLDIMPEKHRVFEREPWCSRGVRVFPVDRYLVFYTVNKEMHQVLILRVMYAARDVDTELYR